MKALENETELDDDDNEKFMIVGEKFKERRDMRLDITQ